MDFTNLRFSFTLLLGLVVAPILAQEKVDIAGKVMDDARQSIPGANLVIKSSDGSASGIYSGLDGDFTFSAAPGDEVTISVMGKASVTKVVPSRSDRWHIVLKDDSQELGEVVVTALGIKKEKKALGYSVQEVKSEAVTEARATNVASSLSGKLAGVTISSNSGGVGGSANVVIRGASSISGSNQPLYVIDGTPILNANFGGGNGSWGGADLGNTAQDISPDDIESISVLKGPAAAALYGNRAANGVILITTKKGQGDLLNVSLNSTVEFSTIQPASLPTFQYEYGGGSVGYSTYPTEAKRTTIEGFAKWKAPDDVKEYPIVDYAEDASWGPKFDPNLKVLHWDAFDPTDKTPWSSRLRSWEAPPEENRVASFFDVGTSFRNNISISGKGKKVGYRLSYSNLDQSEVIPESSVKRHTVNMSFTADPVEYLTIVANATYTNTKGSQRPVIGYNGDNVFQQMFQWTQVQVDYKRLRNYTDGAGNMVTWNRSSADNPFPKYADNPYYIRKEHIQLDDRDRFTGNVSLVGKPLDWVTVTGRVSLDLFSFLQEKGTPVASNEQSSYLKYNHDYSERNFDLIVQAEHPIYDKVTLKGLVGFNHRRNTEVAIGGQTTGGLVFKKYWSLSNSSSPEIQTVDQLRESKYYSTFGSLSVGYDGLLFLEGTGRTDWSSTLPVASNPFFYGSGSGSFVFSEVLPQNIRDVVNFGKFRTSYSKVGKGTDPYAIQGTYGTGNFGNAKLLYRPGTLANADLRPESTVGFEMGLELSLLNRLVRMEGAWYHRSTTDQILRIPVSRSTGYSSIFVNAGEVTNQGIELSLTVMPLQTLELPISWEMNINWNRNRNQVVKLVDGLTNYQIASYVTQVSLNATEGSPLGTIRGSDFKYKDGKRIVASNGYYERTGSSEVIGDMNPDWIGGLGNRLTYTHENLGSVSLYGLIDTKWGGDIYSVTTYYGHFAGNYAGTVGKNDLGNDKRAVVKAGDPKSGGVILDGVTADGKPNTVRIPVGYSLYSRMPRKNWVYDASYVKLREMSLSYSLPKSMLDVWDLKGLTFSLTGRNLLILYKATDHIDPEVSYGTGLAQAGAVEPTFLPSERTYAVNLSLKF